MENHGTAAIIRFCALQNRKVAWPTHMFCLHMFLIETEILSSQLAYEICPDAASFTLRAKWLFHSGTTFQHVALSCLSCAAFAIRTPVMSSCTEHPHLHLVQAL